MSHRHFRWAFRGSFASLLLIQTPLSAVTRYVDENSTNPVAPYTNWTTAANVIQNAVDAANSGDQVLVTNGVYATGGKAVYGTMTNRVVVDKPLNLQSVNGPEVTVIEGYQVPGTINGDGAIRCVYLANGALLSGFTLTNGATRTGGDEIRERSGGGLWCESTNAWISNCVVTGNSCAQYGGGSYFGTLIHCTLTGNSAHEGGGSVAGTLINCILMSNSATQNGGGSRSGTLNNCTLTGNSARRGGGCSFGALNNCILFFNIAASSGDNFYQSDINHSCTVPLPSGGIGNITNAPLFVNTNNWSDLRLQSNSPCINADNNSYVTVTNDLDGNPRIVGDTVDMGAYEFQFPQSTISYAYLQQYGLPTDGSVDDVDGDNDLASTWQEWKMWTNPTNQLSVLRLLSLQSSTYGTMVSWESVAGHSYFLERSTNALEPFNLLQSNIVGQTGLTSFTDTSAPGDEPVLYRVGVPD